MSDRVVSKTNLGALFAAIMQLLEAMHIISPEIGNALVSLGIALAAIGIGDKIQRLLEANGAK